MLRNIVVTALVAAAMAMFVIVGRFYTGTVVPPVEGYLDGARIRFLHTEASDPKVAQLLSRMKGSPVIVVPSLARATEDMLAPVYVFTNGVRGDGPFGFQIDVFDRPPSSDGYTPLRAVHLVAWKDWRTARELRSAADVERAIRNGELAAERPGIVVNMPFVTWPGGNR